jgi:hypothetical protein
MRNFGAVATVTLLRLSTLTAPDCKSGNCESGVLEGLSMLAKHLMQISRTLIQFRELNLVGKLQDQLNGLRAASKALGNSTNREIKGVKKRVLSRAGRAAIAKAAKKRWAKVRKQAKKVAG